MPIAKILSHAGCEKVFGVSVTTKEHTPPPLLKPGTHNGGWRNASVSYVGARVGERGQELCEGKASLRQGAPRSRDDVALDGKMRVDAFVHRLVVSVVFVMFSEPF